jgi:hypothetical protein
MEVGEALRTWVIEPVDDAAPDEDTVETAEPIEHAEPVEA